MTNPNLEEEMKTDNEEQLNSLVSSIELGAGEFYLKLILCNYVELRKSILQKFYQQISSIDSLVIEEITLEPKVTRLFDEIQKVVKEKPPSAVMVLGLEQVEELHILLSHFNQAREQYMNTFKFSLVLWVTNQVLVELDNYAYDFRSGGMPFDFKWTTKVLMDFLHKTTDELFDIIVSNGTRGFLPDTTNKIKLADYSRRYQEFETAWLELQDRNIVLEDRLKASHLFAQGGRYYVDSLKSQALEDSIQRQIELINQAITKYDESLTIFREINDPTGEGTLLYCLSLCYRRLAELNRTKEKEHWSKEKDYLQQACEVFRQVGQANNEAKLRLELGEILQKLEMWEELKQLATNAQSLHRNNSLQLAQDYGFLARVALAQASQAQEDQQPKQVRNYGMEAEKLAKQALKTLNNSSKGHRWHLARYLLLLSQAKKHLDQSKVALKILQGSLNNIQESRKEVDGQDKYDPKLHIEILNELNKTYYERQQYVEAFDMKQERLSVEGQYGLRAFIGASSLKPPVSSTEGQEIKDYAIEASGRRKDVDALSQRISGRQKKLTIIHGPSGVGKTSMIDAGLIPELRSRYIGDYKCLPLSIPLSEKWIQEIGRTLTQELRKFDGNAQLSSLDSAQAIIQTIENYRGKLATIFIFDQFEDFFFICKKPEIRKEFFDFLFRCFNISNLFIVLSLREDYLHYLLEGEKSLQEILREQLNNRKNVQIKQDGLDVAQSSNTNSQLEADYHDWLSSKNRFQLKNFDKESAKLLITKITKRSQFNLEPSLVDQLINDLAGDTSEVRPIELQIVGAQLQEEKIDTLQAYGNLAKQSHEQVILANNPKAILVQKYLNDVVLNCGKENKEAADLVLYLLTDESNKRPIKTLNDLKKSLDNITVIGSLNLVLDIFVNSGLVVLFKEAAEERYQLVHDYLAILIRDQSKSQIKELNDKLEKVTAAQAASDAAKAVAEATAAAEKARADEYEKRIKLEGDLEQVKQEKDQAEREKLLAIQVKDQAEQDKLSAIQVKDQAEQEKKQAEQDKLSAIQVKEQAEREKDEAEISLRKARNSLIGLGVLVPLIVGGVYLYSSNVQRQAEIKKIELDSLQILKNLNSGVLEKSLLDAMLNSKKLKNIVDLTKINNFQDYPAIQPLLTLQQTFDTISRQDSFEYQQEIQDVNLHNRKLLVALNDGDIKEQVWTDNSKKSKKEDLYNIYKKLSLSPSNYAGSKLYFSPDGQYLAISYGNSKERKNIIIWNLQKQKVENEYKNVPSSIRNIEFSSKSRWFAIISEEEFILYDQKHKITKLIKRKQNRPVISMNFSENEEKLVLGYNNGKIEIVNLANSQQDNQVENLGQGKTILKISFSPDTQALAAGLENGSIAIWNLKTNDRFVCPSQGLMETLIFSSNNLLAIGYQTGTLKLMDLECTTLYQVKAYTGAVLGVKFNQDGTQIATYSKKEARLWDFAGLIEKSNLPLTNDQPPNKLYQASLDADGDLLVTGSDHGIELLDLKQFPPRRIAGENTDPTYSIAFNPNSARKSLFATGTADGTLSLWSVQNQLSKITLMKENEIKVDQSSIHSLSFSDDGQILATGSASGMIKLWKLEEQGNKKFLREYAICSVKNEEINTAVLSIRFRPDNQQMATGLADGRIYLWDINPKTCQKNYFSGGHSLAVLSIDFIKKPDNQWWLATGSDDLTARLWDLDGNEKVRFEDHEGKVRSVLYIPSRKLLATASNDLVIRLWTWKDQPQQQDDSQQPISGELVAKYKGHIKSVRNLFWRNQENELVYVSLAHTIRKLPVANSKNFLQDLMSKACKEMNNIPEKEKHDEEYQEVEKNCKEIKPQDTKR